MAGAATYRRLRLAAALLTVAAAAASGAARARAGVSAQASELAPEWVVVEGQAPLGGHAAAASAPRRALADALLQAAMAGGAAVRAHTATQRGRVVQDMTLVRSTGRVLQTRVLDSHREGGTWVVRLRALVGPEHGLGCAVGRRLQVVAYGPDIRVSPRAPAWADPVAMRVFNRLLDALGSQRNVSLTRTGLRTARSDASDPAFDYTALTRGLGPVPQGAHVFHARIDLRPVHQDGGDVLQLRLRMALQSTNDSAARDVTRSVPLPRPGPFAGLQILASPDRTAMIDALTRGVGRDLAALVQQLTCRAPVTRLRYASGRLTVPLGRRDGLSRADMALLDDAGANARMLEITELGSDSAVVRPLDPTVRLSRLNGRRVRFIGVAQ